jgi:hypothetical protein
MIYLLDPDAALDFRFDWSTWLGDAEEISSHTVTSTAGLTVDTSTTDGSTVTAWVSGGEIGNQTVSCLVTTNQGRTDERTIQINVQER